MNTALNGKQNALTAGTGITISNDVISATAVENIYIFEESTPPSDIIDAIGDGKVLYFRFSTGACHEVMTTDYDGTSLSKIWFDSV